ncbi:hypothetical protein SAMN02745121_06993 [Nannocystis exedens]|uniref:Uncharacterized protein n=1 Tax=Nannocystis exedens TaxID=54 RepID=A0A1I2G0D4_9BACT|nr:hypothetical protein [Nannocystis exedens]PCC74628.1 hypothetical protein NAEX_07725 [Nannocystis exedens]SFF11115.1 hypothetical protein SAMN02745121_06993 [Nannocystis exedens]
MSSRIFVSTLALLLFTGACGDGGGDGPDDTTGATADASTTDDTASTTDESPTTTIDSTTDASTDPPTTTSDGATTGDAATGDATTDGDTTTGLPDPDAVAACQAYCQRWDECGLQPDLAGCIEGCSVNQFGLTGACKQANLDVLGCFTALSCDELLASVEDESGACSEQEAAVTDACAGDECSQSVFEGGDECEVQLECADAPVQQMICAGQTCTCLEGGVQVGECAAEGVCAAGDGIFDKTARCCGF